MTATMFDATDLALLLDRYRADGKDEPRRPPWTWAALDDMERDALLRMCAVWVASWNHLHAVTLAELIPPCWPLHPELASEAAVQVWLYYGAHLDPKATPTLAADYYGRHLPGFRTRLERTLGRSPGECRKGQHVYSWRKDVDERIDSYTDLPYDQQQAAVELLASVHFGFPQDTG